MPFDAFLKFDGGNNVVGESTAKGHEKETEIYSFSFGASNPVTIGSGSAGLSGGKASISTFNVMKKSDLASCKLFAACTSGQHYPTATVTLRKATGVSGGQDTFLSYTFEDVMIESIQWSGSSGGDDTPTESLSVAFGKVTIVYSQQDDDTGAMKPTGNASWDQTIVSQ